MSQNEEEKSRLLERLNLFHKTFQHSTDAIILIDLHGAITEANQAFTDLFGWTREEAVGTWAWKSTSPKRSESKTSF